MRRRIDPRAGLGQPGPNGRRRLNRLAPAPGRPRRDPHVLARARQPHSGTITAPSDPVRQAPSMPLRVVPQAAPLVLVVSLTPLPWPDAEAALLGSAHELCPDHAIGLLTFGAPTCDPAAAGADRLLTLPPLAGEDVMLAALDRVIEALAPAHVLLADDGAAGDLARRLAARRQGPAVFGAVVARNGQVVRLLDGGSREASLPAPQILTLTRAACAPVRGDTGYEALTLTPPDLPATKPAFRDEGLELVPARALALKEADLVLSAGAGVSDWQAFAAVADHLSAAIGASRKVCDNGDLPRDRQVGASGSLIEARGYLAFGISGAPQHLQGIQACRHVIAVNTDRHAPIMQRADLAIQGDAQAVLRAIDHLFNTAEGPEDA